MGHDLCDEIIGKWDLASYAFLCVTERKATPSEARLLNALMLAVADHGFTASSLAARLTYSGAPESIQGAFAAGLLGAGSVFLGASQRVGEKLVQLTDNRRGRTDAEISKEEVERALTNRERLPGFGHPIHKPVDPRSVTLFRLAKEEGLYLENCRLMAALHSQLEIAMKKKLTLNAAGASGAIMRDMGFEPSSMRLVAIASRAIGLISHLREEGVNPISQSVIDLVEENADYLPSGFEVGPITRTI
jgi:citrate synthase